jgi:transposase-like protein
VKTKAPAGLRELWRCPVCGRRFANRNQSHACGRHDLGHHCAGKLRHRHVRRIEIISPWNHVHYFRAGTEADLDAEFLELVREAYAVGQQRHL